MNTFGIPVEGKAIRQLCGTVLVMEAVVIGLAIPVAIVLQHANRGVAGGTGGALAVGAVLIGGVVGRPHMGWTLVAGTVLQFLVMASGVVVSAMYGLGVIFAALWFTGLWLARRHATPPAGPSAGEPEPAPSGDAEPGPQPVPTPGPATPRPTPGSDLLPHHQPPSSRGLCL